MRRLIIVSLLLLGACHSEGARDRIRDMEANGMIGDDVTAAEPAPAPAAKPVVIARDDALVDFRYAWPAEAAAVPAIDARFRAEAKKSLDELVAGATEDKAMRAKDGLEFHAYTTAVTWETFGRTERLLSLASAIESFTGGAHPNHGTGTLLWDRTADSEVGFKGLFPSADAGFATIRDAWCRALDKERAKRRGPDYRPEADEPFGKCPGLDELAVIPTDKDGDGRFELLDVRADPYVAGPYAEGDYQIDLPVTTKLIVALRPEFRASFSAQRQ